MSVVHRGALRFDYDTGLELRSCLTCDRREPDVPIVEHWVFGDMGEERMAYGCQPCVDTGAIDRFVSAHFEPAPSVRVGEGCPHCGVPSCDCRREDLAAGFYEIWGERR